MGNYLLIFSFPSELAHSSLGLVSPGVINLQYVVKVFFFSFLREMWGELRRTGESRL